MGSLPVKQSQAHKSPARLRKRLLLRIPPARPRQGRLEEACVRAATRSLSEIVLSSVNAKLQTLGL